MPAHSATDNIRAQNLFIMYGAADAARKRSAEQTAQQGDQGDTNQGNTAASHQLLHTLTLY